jgi:hypothetical protein
MTTQTGVKWEMEADYLETCSCDWGCPCNFEAKPTKGYCSFIVAWHIREGRYGDVRLDGLNIAGAGLFPKAMYEGNGTLIPYVDERADAKQREALLTIMSGQAGGNPWDILSQIISTMLEPRFLPIDFQANGRKSSVKIGNMAEAALTPIKNPVTGEEEEMKLVLPTGFLFKEGQTVMSVVSKVDDEPVRRDQSGQNGYYALVQYSN